MQWQVRGITELSWRDWEQESIVFDSASGDTHLLDQVAACGLKCLEKDWHTEASLAEVLAGMFDESNDEAMQRYVRQLIERLSDMGMLEHREADPE